MKKNLLLLILVILTVCITNAQEGYSWSFGGAPPYNSSPAITGSAGSYQLTTLGGGAITSVSENPGIGSSCSGPINVGQYTTPFGLKFDNNPQFVTNTYTIELTVKFNATGNFHRLIGFTDLVNPGGIASASDYGIYISPDGAGPGNNRLLFYSASTSPPGDYFGPTTITANTWHHLTFARDINGLISCYQNGTFLGAYDDAAGDFIPADQPGASVYDNAITFFKDNLTEEVAGSIAKLSIYNRTLTHSEIVNRTVENACNTTLQLPANAAEGYQWKFESSPFTSTAAIAGSSGDFTLATIGTGSVTTGGTGNLTGLGASCTGSTSFPVGDYTVDAGLIFSNAPRYIYNTYTIEMAVNVSAGSFRRLVGFTDPFSPGTDGSPSDYGIYVDPSGTLLFYKGTPVNGETVGGAVITPGTWHHLTFTRAENNIISCYRNGLLIGTFDDSGNNFLPQATYNNRINFFKDNGGDEAPGQVAKIGLFNVAIIPSDVMERFSTICNLNLVVLPVNLKSFTAVKNGSEVDLSWITASEQNNLGFDVERSANGTDFTAIGFVSGNGTTAQENTYDFTDQSPAIGKNYYRLKQIDIDGRSTYSEIRSIEMDNVGQRAALFPNPSHGSITIRNIKNGSQLAIYNSQGNLVLRKIANNSQELISVEKLATGVYLLQITDKENKKEVIRFSKF